MHDGGGGTGVGQGGGVGGQTGQPVLGGFMLHSTLITLVGQFVSGLSYCHAPLNEHYNDIICICNE